MTDDDPPVNEEHFDSIPWSSLIPQNRDRPWPVYVAAGAVVAIAVGMLAARSLRTVAPVEAPGTATTARQAATTSPTSSLISEADLRAEIQPGATGPMAATTRAEWFVADYFTQDGAGGRETELAGALGRSVPDLVSDVTTYVEWAKAWDAVPEPDGRYRVSVAFRSITATEDGFVRGLARAVAVRVQATPEGGTRVVELPEPIELPVAPLLAAPPPLEPVPVPIASKALERAAMWGEGATVVEGMNDDDSWRVLIEVADDQGTTWPLVVWVEADAP